MTGDILASVVGVLSPNQKVVDLIPSEGTYQSRCALSPVQVHMGSKQSMLLCHSHIDVLLSPFLSLLKQTNK